MSTKTKPNRDSAAAEERIAGTYWRQGDDGNVELIAARCRSCGTLHLPAVPVCANCYSDQFDPAALHGPGKLYAHTVIHVPPAGYPPIYAVGYVDFPEGVRVFGHVRLIDGVKLRADMPVTLESGTLFKRSDGTPVVGYRFAPMTGGNVSRL